MPAFPADELCEIDGFVKVDILDSIQDLNTLIHGALKCFSSGNQTHAACALIDHGSANRIGEIVRALGFSSGADKAGTTHVTIYHLITTKVDRMLRAELGIDLFVQFPVGACAGVQRFVTTCIFRKLLFDDVSLNRYTQVICLTGQVS